MAWNEPGGNNNRPNDPWGNGNKNQGNDQKDAQRVSIAFMATSEIFYC